MSIPNSYLSNIQFLKLGGSLITDKSRPQTARLDVLERLASEIAQAYHKHPDLSLVIGHGSGSFGHVPARHYGTRQGVESAEGWRGFAEVWQAAQILNRLVMDAMSAAGLPVVALSPLASVIAEDGRVARWETEPLQRALQAKLLPVIYGDVVFDRARGGTILSTEDLFGSLANLLSPRRILLAGIEEGVWEDYPACTRLVDEITPGNFATILPALGGSSGTDVTGGMASKVQLSLMLVQENPSLEVLIFSGEPPGVLEQALSGGAPGTLIRTKL
jgi:isopentenyl phosphate kinase